MGERSFARPSRRGELPGDAIRPGRRREGWLLNLVLDTSGSMQDELPAVLGAIGRYAEAAAVDQVRVIQCDAGITHDACVDPSTLGHFRVAGFGGSDLSPALQRLSDEPLVQAVMVVTDGDIAYPPDAPPYRVLWVLTPGAGSAFQPAYGMVIHLTATA
jgi:predicted metal-dependent peptidase